MDSKKYDEVSAHLSEVARGIVVDKRPSYTVGSEDVLANFKRTAEHAGVTPGTVWGIFVLKHLDSVLAYFKNGTTSSESIEGRFADLLNYINLGYAIYREEQDEGMIFMDSEEYDALKKKLDA